MWISSMHDSHLCLGEACPVPASSPGGSLYISRSCRLEPHERGGLPGVAGQWDPCLKPGNQERYSNVIRYKTVYNIYMPKREN